MTFQPSYSIFLKGEPVPKHRHRSSFRGGKIVGFDPQKGKKIGMKWEVASKFREIGLLKPLEGPVFLVMVFRHSFPKSWPQKRIMEIKRSGSFKTSRPDLDNCEKLIKDVMTGIAYNDDAQVVQICSEKRYSDKPGIEITVLPRGLPWSMSTLLRFAKNALLKKLRF